MRCWVILMVLMAAGASTGRAATINTLVDFSGVNGSQPLAGLIVDSAGNLLGTTRYGGTSGDGTVFELENVGGGSYQQTTLVNFNGSNGANPYYGSLYSGVGGNIFGTTLNGGANGGGTLFEVSNSGGTYANSATTLVNFGGSLTAPATPSGTLIGDAAGNLFGTTRSGGTYLGPPGGSNQGTVYKLSFSNGSYATTPTTLASFGSGVAGRQPDEGVIADRSGNLFGVTSEAGTGASNAGTVFEIPFVSGSYGASTQLASLSAEEDDAGLVMDSSGDLFGTTTFGGANNDGAVYELVNNGGGNYTQIILASLGGGNGCFPNGGLIIDAGGDLFGTATSCGANSDGTVFEIPYTAGSYASAPIVLANLNATTGYDPMGNLVADATGDLFGVAQLGGTSDQGTAYEIAGAGFEPLSQGTDVPEPSTIAGVWIGLIFTARRVSRLR